MSGHFIGAVHVEALANGRDWRLLAPLVYRSGPLTVEVPKGFVTDFASVPRVLWPVLPPIGRYNKAAILHDYLYRMLALPRIVADAIFVSGMKTLEVQRWRRVAMYLGVRAFGWHAYRRGRREIIKMIEQ